MFSYSDLVNDLKSSLDRVLEEEDAQEQKFYGDESAA